MNTSSKLQSFISKDRNIVIGALHFPPLLGYADFPGYEIATANALTDLKAFEDGGADAVIVENNYDVPHKEFVDASVAESLSILSREVKSHAKIPVGISVLWNDYKVALTIAKDVGLDFIRVPVFVDIAKNSYGTVVGDADAVVAYRKEIGAESIALCVDIHVKHAEILSTHTLAQSALLSIEKGADALIVTGKWTGDAPVLDELKELRAVVGDFPILCGSGVSAENAKALFTYANGAIVSTSLKVGQENKTEVNVKPYNARISKEKVAELVESIKV